MLLVYGLSEQHNGFCTKVISTVYIGSLNASLVRVDEIFKEALKRNSAALMSSTAIPPSTPRPAPRMCW